MNKEYSIQEFRDVVVPFLDRRVRHYTLQPIINWCGILPFHPDSVHFIQAHPEVFRNLFSMAWWRSQHNREEVEMRRHPNRSQHWIGNRLEKARTEFISGVFDNQAPEQEIGCRLCFSSRGSPFDMNAGFCPSCWERYGHPYLNAVISYALDSNPN